jgi:hypothetical protein
MIADRAQGAAWHRDPAPVDLIAPTLMLAMGAYLVSGAVLIQPVVPLASFPLGDSPRLELWCLAGAMVGVWLPFRLAATLFPILLIAFGVTEIPATQLPPSHATVMFGLCAAALAVCMGAGIYLRQISRLSSERLDRLSVAAPNVFRRLAALRKDIVPWRTPYHATITTADDGVVSIVTRGPHEVGRIYIAGSLVFATTGAYATTIGLPSDLLVVVLLLIFSGAALFFERGVKRIWRLEVALRFSEDPPTASVVYRNLVFRSTAALEVKQPSLEYATIVQETRRMKTVHKALLLCLDGIPALLTLVLASPGAEQQLPDLPEALRGLPVAEAPDPIRFGAFWG